MFTPERFEQRTRNEPNGYTGNVNLFFLRLQIT